MSHDMPQQLRDLLDMLSYMRPYGSRSDRKFRNRFIRPLGTSDDSARNLHLVIPRADGTMSRVLWSAHTDTVHRISGRQRLDWNGFTVRLAPGQRQANCLGADDTVGCWLLREMALARVPGHYVWHYGEESGGIGSRQIVWTEPERFDGLRFAIAFDRAGHRDVITHQAGGRTCSDVCAHSIAAELERNGLSGYEPAHGIFTDTAEYVDVIGECTNLSVGYAGAHTDRETTDLRHAAYLLTAMLGFDESRLIAKRVPGEVEPLPPRVVSAWDTRPIWDRYGWNGHGSATAASFGTAAADDSGWDWYPRRQRGRAQAVPDDGYDYARFESEDRPLTDEDRRMLRAMGLAPKYR